MARLKKRKDGRYQRKVTLSNGKQKFVYGKTIAEVNAAANALMNQDTAGLEVGDHTLVGEWAKIWLKNYKSDLRAATIKMYRDTPHLSRYIVPAADGGDMTRSAFTRLWNSHVAALVPFSLHPHMLRHTYATTLYRAGVDLRTAQKLMGHSSIQVTADIYTHLEQEDSLHVADKLNEYLSGKSENSAKSSQKVVKLAI